MSGSFTALIEACLLIWILTILQPPDHSGSNAEKFTSLKLVKAVWKFITGEEQFPVIFGSIFVYFLAFTTCYLLQRFAKRVLPSNIYQYAADFFFTMVVCAYPYSHGTVRSLYGHVGYLLTSVPLATLTGHFFEGTSSPLSVFHRYIRNKETLKSCVVRTAVQTGAAFMSFHLVYAIWSLEVTKAHQQNLRETECETDLKINWMNGFFIEFGAVVADTWVSEHRLIKNRVVDTAIKNAFGSLLVCFGVHVTGMYMHPAMASGISWNCQGTHFTSHILVYWVSAFLGLAVGLKLNKHWFLPHLLLEDTLVQPMKENVVQPVMDSMVHSVLENFVQPVVNSMLANVVQPVVKNVVQPVVENLIQPMVKNVVDNVFQPARENMVDKVITPVEDTVIQSVIENAVEPEMDNVTDNIVRPKFDGMVQPVNNKSRAIEEQRKMVAVIESKLMQDPCTAIHQNDLTPAQKDADRQSELGVTCINHFHGVTKLVKGIFYLAGDLGNDSNTDKNGQMLDQIGSCLGKFNTLSERDGDKRSTNNGFYDGTEGESSKDDEREQWTTGYQIIC